MSAGAPSAGTPGACTLERCQELLGALAGPSAVLRTDQFSAIDALVNTRGRVLVVQRTGWGKSAVYWIATRLLRDAGAGPTLVVSPLLALMLGITGSADMGERGRKARTRRDSPLPLGLVARPVAPWMRSRAGA